MGLMHQGSLFDGAFALPPRKPPVLSATVLLAWQERIHCHQARVRQALGASQQPVGQLALLPGSDAMAGLPRGFDPLTLVSQPLNFWRWPQAPNHGAAHYFVVDEPPHLEGSLLLYVGETGTAATRWKGDHDCKGYLAAYGDVLRQAGLRAALSIRFWCDAPRHTAARRAQERALIQCWWPPFNKEMQGRWTTPFTALTG